MADPLSIAASILAILGACAASVKTIKSLCDTPHELRRLEIELDHLKAVVRDVQGNVKGMAAFVYSKGLSDALYTASASVQQVSDFVQDKLYQDRHATRRARKRACFRYRERIKAFASEMASTRSKLLDHIATSTL
jgi:hypothetical protein